MGDERCDQEEISFRAGSRIWVKLWAFFRDLDFSKIDPMVDSRNDVIGYSQPDFLVPWRLCVSMVWHHSHTRPSSVESNLGAYHAIPPEFFTRRMWLTNPSTLGWQYRRRRIPAMPQTRFGILCCRDGQCSPHRMLQTSLFHPCPIRRCNSA